MITKTLWLLATLFLAHVQLATAQHPAKAQSSRKFARVGYLSPFTMSSGFRGPFRQQLHELGYIEGKNIAIEARAAEGSYDRLRELASELVRLQVDTFFVDSNLAARAVKEATQTIPVVVYSGDLVGTQLVTSLARPGGNITGVTNLSPDLSAKRLELLRETLPSLKLFAVLWDAAGPVPLRAFKEVQVAAEGMGLKILSLEIRSPEPDLDGTLKRAAKKSAEALLVIANPLTSKYRKQIVELANVNRLPSMYPTRGWLDHGGLMSYGVIDEDLYCRAALYVDKILKGAKPADLPVEQPTKFEFLINLKTAKQIGVTVPPNVLARADKVIK